MKELDIKDLQLVYGGADWGEVGVGLASVGLGITLVATAPASPIILGTAAMLSFLGGAEIGDGMIEGHGFDDLRRGTVTVGKIQGQPMGNCDCTDKSQCPH